LNQFCGGGVVAVGFGVKCGSVELFKYKGVTFFKQLKIMSTPCESVARYILPLYRSFVAKELIEKYDYTQVRAAKKIGTTQAAISQYITSKRGHKGISNYDEIAPLVQKAAAKVAKRIVAMDTSPKEFSESFCEICKSAQLTKKL
jgi:predicted transcriptional regulator